MAGLVTQVGFIRLGLLNMSNSGKPEFECHPRLSGRSPRKAWMPGIKPGMTRWKHRLHFQSDFQDEAMKRATHRTGEILPAR